MAQSPNKINGTDFDDALNGTGGPDAIYGFRGRDSIKAGAGDDLLDGGRGVDRMYGGDGDDTYVVDNLSDRVIELFRGGIDTVLASVRLVVLGANVENLSFTNSARHTGHGNGLDNAITGGTGNDKFYGKGGDDILNGGGGDDYLSGGLGVDKLYGGNGRDMMFGGFGNDFLDGGLGIDDMNGGRGNDSYIVDNISDRVHETAGAGTDHVQSTVDFTLSGSVENLTLVGTRAADGIGNLLDNVIVGNGADNVLKGRQGDDTLAGMLGNDRLTGGQGADRFVFDTLPNTTVNFDIITDFNRFEEDKIVLSKEIFADFTNTGRVAADSFYAAPGAVRAKEDGQFLIYNTTTGALYYDAEGPDGRGPALIAQLGTKEHPDISFLDFAIIA